MLEAILGAIPGFFEMFQKISKKSPSKQEYDSLRRMAAEALTMNACYYCNPVDIAHFICQLNQRSIDIFCSHKIDRFFTFSLYNIHQ